MNATEMRNISNGTDINAEDKSVHEVLEKVIERMKRFALEGRRSAPNPFWNINCFDPIKKCAIRKLESLGYTYKIHENPDPGNPTSCSYDEICW